MKKLKLCIVWNTYNFTSQYTNEVHEYIVIQRIFINSLKIKVSEYNYNSQPVTPHIRAKKSIGEQKWKQEVTPNRFLDQGHRPCSGSSPFLGTDPHYVAREFSVYFFEENLKKYIKDQNVMSLPVKK